MKVSNHSISYTPLRPNKENEHSDSQADPTPDPEYQPSVQWDVEPKSNKKYALEGVTRSEWTQGQENSNEEQNNRGQKVTNTTKDDAEIELTDKIVLTSIDGYVLTFSADGKPPKRFHESNYLFIPLKDWGNREAKMEEFLRGKNLHFVTEQPISVRTLEYINAQLKEIFQSPNPLDFLGS